MKLRNWVGKIHLWLGLGTGLVVSFLGITGCILAFEQEIRLLTDWEQVLEQDSGRQLPPSVLKPIAERAFGGHALNSLEYGPAGRAVQAAWYNETNYEIALLHPASGVVLKKKNMNRDFFRIVLNGHFYLWLPPKIGRPVVATATLIFLVLMITGIILWWPRNKAARKQRFGIKWNARWRRKNYDLHNVAGFYASWVLIFIAITGLVWGFEWFERSFYWISAGGRAMPVHQHPLSDTGLQHSDKGVVADELWQYWAHRKGRGESLAIYYPQSTTDALEVGVNHRPGTYYNVDYYHYDQYSGSELPATGTYAGAFKDATVADKIKRLNYDIHVGAVFGLAGKILAFFASLIAASLPVTGFYIWWGRRKKSRVLRRLP